MAERRTVLRKLAGESGTFAGEAGITLRDTPAPLYQLLVLASLLAKPIDSGLAASGARELRKAGGRTPKAMLSLTWQQRVDALGRAHYRRFDESMATRVGELAQYLLDEHGGDVRKLVAPADGDARKARKLLTDLPGLGPTGADIVLREAQSVWSWARPYLDERVLQGAAKVGLPKSARGLADVIGSDPAAAAALLVRVTLDDDLAARVRDELRSAKA